MWKLLWRDPHLFAPFVWFNFIVSVALLVDAFDIIVLFVILGYFLMGLISYSIVHVENGLFSGFFNSINNSIGMRSNLNIISHRIFSPISLHKFEKFRIILFHRNTQTFVHNKYPSKSIKIIKLNGPFKVIYEESCCIFILKNTSWIWHFKPVKVLFSLADLDLERFGANIWVFIVDLNNKIIQIWG